MKNPFSPPPSLEGLHTREVHELVRDYPELFPVLERAGVKWREGGGQLLSEAVSDADPRWKTLLRDLAWRGQVGA